MSSQKFDNNKEETILFLQEQAKASIKEILRRAYMEILSDTRVMYASMSGLNMTETIRSCSAEALEEYTKEE
jgi:hypothetical protein